MITQVDVQAVGPKQAQQTLGGPPPHYETLTIVRLFDDDGYEGIGGTTSYTHGQFDLSILETLRAIAPRLVGKDPGLREGVSHALNSRGDHELMLPVAPGAQSAIDIAMWDLTARRAGVPLYRLLGGVRDRLPAYASTPVLQDAAAYVDLCYELRDLGFRAIKFHAWCDPDRDLEMIRAVHAVHGDAGIAFMHDAEQRYDRRSALRVAQALEEMDFRWLEAPLPDTDLHGYRELRQRVRVPILAAGNTIIDLPQVRDALRFEPWDALRIDMTVAGGFTQGRKLMALAEAWGLGTELQSWSYTFIQAPNVHMGLAFESTGYFELPVPYSMFEFGAGNPFRVDKDGYVNAPTGPGLGLDVDWEQIQDATLGSFSTATSAIAG